MRQLAKVQVLLRDLFAELDPATVTIPVEAQAHIESRVKKGECLQCGNELAKEERVSRGLCARCYNRTMQRIGRNEVPEADIIASGLILREINHGGRKAVGPDPVGDMIRPSRGEQHSGKTSPAKDAEADSGQTPGQETKAPHKKRGKTQ